MPMKMFLRREPGYRGTRCLRGKLGDLVAIDVDWRPGHFGTCAWIGFGRRMQDGHNVGWAAATLDWFDPDGAPNRLYLFGPRWHYMIGLPTNLHEEFEDTDETYTFRGEQVPLVRYRTVRGRWRVTRGQPWSREDGWSQSWKTGSKDDWTWFVRSPRKT